MKIVAPRKKLLFVLFLLFLAGAAIGMYVQFHFHKFMNIDTLSYINIAEIYAAGKISLAINGCWAPLYSWIIALFLLAGIPALATCYVLNFIAAGYSFYLLFRISSRYLWNVPLLVLFNLFTIFYLLNQALSALTPDLIAAAIGLYFLNLLIDEDYYLSRRKQVIAGIVAALFFFAKAYNLVFVSGLLIVLAGINFIGNKRNGKQLATGYLLTGLVFFVISLLWIIPLSLHERKITFSTSGAYVYKMVHPDNADHPASHHIIPPPFPEAYSAWIDPTHHLDSMAWSPFQNKQFFDHQVYLIKSSFTSLVQILDSRLIRFFLILVTLILARGYPAIKAAVYKRELMIPVLFVVAYPLGYLPIFVFERYILISLLIYQLLFFYFVQALLVMFRQRLQILTVGGMLLLITIPGVKYAYNAWHQKKYEYRIYRAFYLQKNEFRTLKDKKIIATRSSHVLSSQLCYLFNCRFYGIWNEADIPLARASGVEFLVSGEEIKSPILQQLLVTTVQGYVVYIYRIL